METFDQKINRAIRYYTNLAGSSDPLEIAKSIGIGIAILPLGNIAGNYKLLKRKKWIFINDDIPISSTFFNIFVAHELGHAIFHRKENCAFIKKKTLLLTSGIEREANIFAARLLITDDMLKEYAGFTKEQFCRCTGYAMELIDLRLK